MTILTNVQLGALLLLGVVLLGVEVWALIEALRGRSAMYQAYGKLTKPAWVAITAVAVLLGVLGLRNPVSLSGIAAIVAAGVFLADVRPLVRPPSKRGGTNGPYGPW